MSAASSLPLRKLMQSLSDPEMATRAAQTLVFLHEDQVTELMVVMLDPACDHPDDDPAWDSDSYHPAGSANLELAKRLIDLAPGFIRSHTLQLTTRRSAKFKHRLLEFLLEKKCEPLDQILQLALNEKDGYLRSSFLRKFKSGLGQTDLPLELREKLYDVLKPMLQLPQGQFHRVDYSELLTLVHPERANEFFASVLAIDLQHPQLEAIVGHPAFLKSPHSQSLLAQLYAAGTQDKPQLNRDELDRVAFLLNAVIAQHSFDHLSLLEEAAARPEPKLRRLGLDGIIFLKLPYDPVRKARELVRSKRLSKLSPPVRLVGFASLYAELFNNHDVLDFVESVKASEYVACMEALGQLQEMEHLALLTELMDELGDNPRAALRRESRRRAIYKRFGDRAEKLEVDQLEESIHRYVLQHEAEFLAIRSLECD